MAKKQNGDGSEAPADGANSEAGTGNGASKAMPKGFRLLSSVSDAPWVSNEEGNVCQGELLGRYQMNNDLKTHYYQVLLAKPCRVRVGTGEDAEVEEVEAGVVVNLNENHQIKVLTEVVVPETLAGGSHEVYVEFGKKVKLKSGGKTMWHVKVASKTLRAPTRPVTALPKESVSSEETPF